MVIRKEELQIIVMLGESLKLEAYLNWSQAMHLCELLWWEPILMTYWFNIGPSQQLADIVDEKLFPSRLLGFLLRIGSVTISHLKQNFSVLRCCCPHDPIWPIIQILQCYSTGNRGVTAINISKLKASCLQKDCSKEDFPLWERPWQGNSECSKHEKPELNLYCILWTRNPVPRLIWC